MYDYVVPGTSFRGGKSLSSGTKEKDVGVYFSSGPSDT